MNCTVSATIGLSLLAGSVATLTVSEEQHNLLKKTLSPELDQVYDNIARERRNHYIQGLIIGLLISFFVLSNSRITNRTYKITLFFAITLTSGLLYYLLMPKSDYMLNHLTTPEENKAWLEVYKTMKFRYLVGLILGAAAAIPFANSMC